ncbi:alpha/beta-hydrolase [Lentithecium fluviatile CBS 122367]|uniref:Carboxylic ester hydrolase n=1 Tax=Lentithecium fluviatile CBS 122367 TaxID=1168545 RepID=A0A6G1IJ15_9PLEO|nr:alpha/beta-hydrolase [Lentithecium fluviatile CBS 122367]
MKLAQLLSIPLAATITAIFAQPTTGNNTTSPHLTVCTSTGTYTGHISPSHPKTLQFLSIPYAQPPIQSHRFLPPLPLPLSTTHHNATTLPPSCPQYTSAIPSLLSTYFAAGLLSPTRHISEDCLYLSIWTPSHTTPASNLPVLVFLPGGGFQTGGINVPYQLPESWIARSQSHIVVSINYRLDIFGFPNAAGLREQNLGLLDQRAALEWVRENVRAFGGDAGKIVLWGQSAGGMATDALAHAFWEDPIARGLFLQSGTVFSGVAVEDGTGANFSFVAKGVGCDGTGDAIAELDCMRWVPSETITNFIGQYADSGAVPALSFLPVVDERLVFSDYAARAASGKVARLPTILSTTANEGSSLVPFPASNPSAGFPQSVILAVTLFGFVCPTYNSTVERNEFDIPVYRYQYAGTFPNTNPFNWTGAYHGSDIPLIFGTYGVVKDLGNTTELEVETSWAMQDHILAFTKDPYHGPQEIGWNPMSEGGKLVRFGAGGKAVQYVDAIEVDGVCQGIGEYDAFP